MKLNYEEYKGLVNDINELKNDLERLEFAKLNKDNILVVLGKDSTKLWFDINSEDFNDNEYKELKELMKELDLEASSFNEYYGSRNKDIEHFENKGIRAIIK